jgi:hypothetical protein
VDDENLKKAFAIFTHTCYNVCVIEKSNKTKLVNFAVNRIGLILGCLIFIAAVYVGNSFIFKIKVTGSGNYLENEVLSIIDDAGLQIGDYYKSLDKQLALSRIMSLPNVTFCSIERDGSALIIDVQTNSEDNAKVNYSPLVSDVNGVLKELVVICGSGEVAVGQTVQKGQSLIGAYSEAADGTTTTSLVVGYAKIECTRTESFAAKEESENNKKLAISIIQLYTDNPEEVSYTVKKDTDGVIYEVTFSYLHTQSLNME